MLQGLKSLFRRSIQKRKAEPRGGYFLIFFALVLTILTLPLLGTVLSETIDVQGSISRFQDSTFIRGRGDSLLHTVLRTNTGNGLGYYKKGVYPESRADDELQVNYFFSGASVIPVPTAKYGLEDFGATARCEDADGEGTISDPDYNADSYECNELAEVEDAVVRVDSTTDGATRPSYYYTSPALGTGTAGDECEFHKLNLGKTYTTVDSTGRSTDFPVDPLDDPCNWNVLALGETVAVPLYTRDPNNPDQIIIRQPENLKLRVRFPCADGSEVCAPNERQVISWDEDGDGVEDVDPDSIDEDATPRVINWVIKSENTFTPDTNWFSGEDFRPQLNSELTVQRLRLFGLDPRSRFSYQTESVSSLINVLNVDFADITFAFQSFGVSPRYSDYFSGLSSYFSSTFSNEGGLFLSSGGTFNDDGDYVISGEDAVGPVLIMQFIDGIFKDVDDETINRMEYQLVSSDPLGNDRFVVIGDSLNSDGESYTLSQQSASGPDEDTAGVVFGN